MDLETLPDGHSDLLLYGEFRFELEREIAGPYRQAVVRPVEEPWLNERDAGIVAVRTADRPPAALAAPASWGTGCRSTSTTWPPTTRAFEELELPRRLPRSTCR